MKALKAPIPQADPKAVAWMTAEMKAPRQHDSLVKKPMSLFNNGPRQEKYRASQFGTPNMTPESENEGDVDILSGGQSRVGVGTGIVATVSPGSPGVTTGGAENVTPAGEGGEAKPEAAPDATKNEVAPAAGTAATEATPKTDAAAGASGTADPAATKSDAAAGAEGASQNADGTKTDATAAQGGPQTDNQTDNNGHKKESSSKKKKGLKKIIPW